VICVGAHKKARSNVLPAPVIGPGSNLVDAVELAEESHQIRKHVARALCDPAVHEQLTNVLTGGQWACEGGVQIGAQWSL
jgi:hypothetical protein